MHGRFGVDPQIHRSVPTPGVVGAVAPHRSRPRRVVDEPSESLLGIPRGPEQRKGVPLRLRERAGDPEAEGRQTIARRRPVAVRHAEIRRRVLPASATCHALIAVPPLPCTAVDGHPLIARVPAILHPLPHVAMHVVEPERVGGERARRRRLPDVPIADDLPIGLPGTLHQPEVRETGVRALRASDRPIDTRPDVSPGQRCGSNGSGGSGRPE